MRILIVDDSAMMRAMIKRVIELTDVPVEEILEASNGARGARTARERTTWTCCSPTSTCR